MTEAEASIRAALEAPDDDDDHCPKCGIAGNLTSCGDRDCGLCWDTFQMACTRDNITALLAELDAVRASDAFHVVAMEEFHAQRDAALARAEAAEADARRYRWLRDEATEFAICQWIDDGYEEAFWQIDRQLADSILSSALAQSTTKEGK